MLRLEPVRYRWHSFLLGVPIIGRLRSGMATARFANTLAVLVGSGVPVVKALGYAGASLDDLVFREGVNAAIESVREGVGISRALQAAGPFPSLLLHLVASGEASGELPVGPRAGGQAAGTHRRGASCDLHRLARAADDFVHGGGGADHRHGHP
jgi:general secretion pathway protein F